MAEIIHGIGKSTCIIRNFQEKRFRKRFRCAAFVLCVILAIQSPNYVQGQGSAPVAPSSSPAFGTIIPTTVGKSPAPATVIATSAPSSTSPVSIPTSTTIAPSPLSTSPPTRSSSVPIASTLAPSTHPSSSTPVALGTTIHPTMQTTTHAPVVPPTTNAPSSSPTVATVAPTQAPVVPPTIKPTRLPTKRPTISPSHAPVATTNSPTVSTNAPTFVTSAPSVATPAPTPQVIPLSHSPSTLPSATPSNFATTTLPTSHPSTEVVTKPTSQPVKPTAEPTSGRTSRPTSVKPSSLSVPTFKPSQSPTSAPSSPTQPTVAVVMLLENTTTELITSSEATWISATVSFISQSVQPPLQNVTVTINITNQQLVRSGNRRRNRRLAQKTVPLQISFITMLSYASQGNYQPSVLVGQAFNSVAKRDAYVGMLQRTGDPTLSVVSAVQVLVDGQIPVEDDIQTAPPSSKSKFPTAIVAAVAGGGCFLLIVLVGLFLVCRSKQKVKQDGKAMSSASPSAFSGQDRMPVASEIVMESQDDVSTLGDPMFPGSGGMLLNGIDKDENTASITDDYDYARQYRMAAHQPSESSLTRERFESVDDSAKDSSDLSKLGLGKMSESFFSDDASFEEQFVDQDERFEVLAPAGKLGMVIDTPSGGVPVVHAIKDNSVLSDAVRVGDRLISVDGEDCSAMTAMQVSKLISLKANNSTRTLVFIRRGTDGTALAHDE